MKTKLLLSCLCSLLLIPIFAATVQNLALLTWQYPTAYASDTNASFNLFSASNLSGPWTITTNIPAVSSTNSDGTNTHYALDVAVTGPTYFYLQATSVFWGNALTSNVAYAPPVPLITTLNIQKGP